MLTLSLPYLLLILSLDFLLIFPFFDLLSIRSPSHSLLLVVLFSLSSLVFFAVSSIDPLFLSHFFPRLPPRPLLYCCIIHFCHSLFSSLFLLLVPSFPYLSFPVFLLALFSPVLLLSLPPIVFFAVSSVRPLFFLIYLSMSSSSPCCSIHFATLLAVGPGALSTSRHSLC